MTFAPVILSKDSQNTIKEQTEKLAQEAKERKENFNEMIQEKEDNKNYKYKRFINSRFNFGY